MSLWQINDPSLTPYGVCSLEQTIPFRFTVGMDEKTEGLLWRSRWLRQWAKDILARIAELKERIRQRALSLDQVATRDEPGQRPDKSG